MPITWRNINGGESRGALLGLEGAGGSLDRASDAFESIFNTYGKTQEANYKAESDANTDAYLDAIAGANSAEDLERLESDGTLEGLRNVGPIDRDAIRGQSEDRLSELYSQEKATRERELEALEIEMRPVMENIKYLHANGQGRKADELTAQHKDKLGQLGQLDEMTDYGTEAIRKFRQEEIDIINHTNVTTQHTLDKLAADPRVEAATDPSEATAIFMQLVDAAGLDRGIAANNGYYQKVETGWLARNDISDFQAEGLSRAATADAAATADFEAAERAALTAKWNTNSRKSVLDSNSQYLQENYSNYDGKAFRKDLAAPVEEGGHGVDPDEVSELFAGDIPLDHAADEYSNMLVQDKVALTNAIPDEVIAAVGGLKEGKKHLTGTQFKQAFKNDPAFWAMLYKSASTHIQTYDGGWADWNDIDGDHREAVGLQLIQEYRNLLNVRKHENERTADMADLEERILARKGQDRARSTKRYNDLLQSNARLTAIKKAQTK